MNDEDYPVLEDYQDGDVFGYVGSDDDPIDLANFVTDDKPKPDKIDRDRDFGPAPDSPRPQGSLIAVWMGLIAFAALGTGAWALIKKEAAPPVANNRPGANPTSLLSGSVTLEGPGGHRETLPLGEPAVVHVWLQGCSDCMSSFEAYRDGMSNGTLDFGVPVINVAYGNASEDWAKSYGVDERLVFDPGSAVVQPLGIGTFTTLVMDADGRVVHRDYPRNPGYADRIRAALQTLGVEPPEVESPR